MPIRRLPPLLVNQIAAGEVIERPASVVKELVENSLDAGATRIDVAVEDGGMQLIRIADDGCGIGPEELALALTAHATSKLHTAEDLAAIHTLGFRGEALASIASVSRLRLSSRTRDHDAGHCIEQSGGEVSEPRPHAMASGTVIEVRDLFHNTPARRRFMRTAATEFGHIADTLGRVAMVHPAVGFTLSHHGRTTLDLPPHQDRRQRCVAILGKDLDEALLEVDGAALPARDGARPPTASLWALIGEPSIARGSGKFQYLCVNGRPVKDRNLGHAVKEAFRGLIAPDRYPVAAVFVTIDPAEVDVNVHPTKAEVRFRNASAVHGLVLSHLRQRLLGADLTPVVGAGGWGLGAGKAPPADQLPLAAAGGEVSGASPTPSAFVDYFKRMDPTQKGFVFDEVRREMAEHDLYAEASTPVGPNLDPRSPTPSAIQFKNSYVVTQDDEGILIVDQHALHERVMFEELRRRILVEGKNLESQRLLMPAVVEADASRQAAVAELAPLLTRLGIEAEPLGPKAVAVHAFPSLLFDRRVEPVAFVNDLLDKAEAGELSPTSLHAGGRGEGGVPAADAEAALHRVLDMMSCKAAIKAGDPLGPVELATLLAKRQEIERSSSCPHGRPTTVRLTVKDLEKHFHRT